MIFGNPGTTELPLMDAFATERDIRYVLALQEAPAMGMADGYAQASGQLSCVNLHAAPGLGNAMGMLYDAQKAGAPIIVTAGQHEQRFNFTEPLLWADLPVVQSLFNRNNYFQTVRARLAGPAALAELKDYVENDPRLKLEVKSESQYFAGQASRTFDLIQKLGWPLAIAMAFGALAGALNTMYSSVAARTLSTASPEPEAPVE